MATLREPDRLARAKSLLREFLEENESLGADGDSTVELHGRGDFVIALAHVELRDLLGRLDLLESMSGAVGPETFVELGRLEAAVNTIRALVAGEEWDEALLHTIAAVLSGAGHAPGTVDRLEAPLARMLDADELELEEEVAHDA